MTEQTPKRPITGIDVKRAVGEAILNAEFTQAGRLGELWDRQKPTGADGQPVSFVEMIVVPGLEARAKKAIGRPLSTAENIALIGNDYAIREIIQRSVGEGSVSQTLTNNAMRRLESQINAAVDQLFIDCGHEPPVRETQRARS